MAIVYIHRRLDIKDDFKNVFYVGIGKSKKRANETYHSRSVYWKNVINKCGGFTVEITHSNLIWEEACSIERYLISFYGRKDLGLGNLCNLTDGGDGVVNWSDDLREKHCILQKKIQNRPEIKAHKSRILLELRKSTDLNKKISDSLKSYYSSEEKRKDISERRKNYFVNKDNLLKHSKLMKEVHGRLENIKKNRETRINIWKGKRDLPTGVYKHGNGYRAKISKNNKTVQILYSNSVEECHQAYLKYMSNL
jgi:hypothetical protein